MKEKKEDINAITKEVKSQKGLARGQWSAGVLYYRRRKQKTD